MPLTELFAAIEKQTGNKMKDNRQQDPAEVAAAGDITIELKDEPFWSAVDKILDEAKLGVYNYGGEDALSIVARNEDDGPRHGKAAYVGPFRMEILEVQAQRNARQPANASCSSCSWKSPGSRGCGRSRSRSRPPTSPPRTTPAIRSPSASPRPCSTSKCPPARRRPRSCCRSDAPPRSVNQIKSLKGKLKALVPGRQEKFRFGDLANAAGKSQRRGGVEVTVDDVRKNNEIWEVHMRMKLDEDNHAFESHRDWVFQNVSVPRRQGRRNDRQRRPGNHQADAQRSRRRLPVRPARRHRRPHLGLRNAGSDRRAAGRVRAQGHRAAVGPSRRLFLDSPASAPPSGDRIDRARDDSRPVGVRRISRSDPARRARTATPPRPLRPARIRPVRRPCPARPRARSSWPS